MGALGGPIDPFIYTDNWEPEDHFGLGGDDLCILNSTQSIINDTSVLKCINNVIIPTSERLTQRTQEVEVTYQPKSNIDSKNWVLGGAGVATNGFVITNIKADHKNTDYPIITVKGHIHWNTENDQQTVEIHTSDYYVATITNLTFGSSFSTLSGSPIVGWSEEWSVEHNDYFDLKGDQFIGMSKNPKETITLETLESLDIDNAVFNGWVVDEAECSQDNDDYRITKYSFHKYGTMST